MYRLLISVAVVFAAALLAGPAVAQNVAATPNPADAHAIIAKMIERNPSLDSYRSRVHVDVRMTSFPFLSPKLDGTTYYKRPDNYEVVFDRVPSYAKNFSKLFDDVGDAGSWEKDHDITVDPMQTVDGRQLLVLRLTKKIHSTILDHALAFVDPATYELVQMEWDYTSGGKIVMTQQYRSEGGFTVLSSQHAMIHIPYVHAVADATYAAYQTNVAVEDTVFTKP